MAETHITELHKYEFEALRDPIYTNFALVSCFLNGQPTVAIAAITEGAAPHEVHIVPLWVYVTPDMVLTNHDGEPTQRSTVDDSG